MLLALPELGCLATYVSYVPCVNLSMVGVVPIPLQQFSLLGLSTILSSLIDNS